MCTHIPEGQIYPGLRQKQAWPAGRGRGFCHFTLVRLHLESCIQLWCPQNRKDGAVGAGPEEGQKIIRGKEHLSCEERLRELGLFSLEKRRLWGDLIAAFQYWKGAIGKIGKIFLARPVAIGQGLMALN